MRRASGTRVPNAHASAPGGRGHARISCIRGPNSPVSPSSGRECTKFLAGQEDKRGPGTLSRTHHPHPRGPRRKEAPLGTVIICERSALLWWRTPPVVRWLLAVETPEEPDLLLDPHDVDRAQAGSARELTLWREAVLSGRRGRPLSSASADGIFAALDRIATSVEAPVDVLVTSSSERRDSSLVRPHVWSDDLPEGSVVQVGRDLWATSPAFSLLMLARRLPLARVAMLATELCGCFSTYEPPRAVRELLEEQHAEGTLVRMGAWSPSFDGSGRLTGVWSRPAPVRPGELAGLARACAGKRGSRRLADAAALVVPGAASPLEARTGILLGWPRRRGGEGLGGFAHNARVELSEPAQALARRRSCYCDLLWPAADGHRALDLECQSATFHASAQGHLDDTDRTAALQLMGIDVVGATHAQLADEARFDALAELVATRLGRTRPTRSEALVAARRELRAEVLADWESLPG